MELEGNIFTDVGSPHYRAYKSLENFWDLYRGTQHAKPTIAQYNEALWQSMVDSGMTQTQATKIVEYAAQQQLAYGFKSDSLVPHIPNRINLKK